MPATAPQPDARNPAEGVLAESGPHGALVLWSPGGADRTWDRVAGVPYAAAAVDRGVCSAPASLIPARPPARGRLGAFLRRAARPDPARRWTLPDGEAVEQSGPRRTDVLLAWAEDDDAPLDDARVRAHWPGCRDARRLARNLFLVDGVEPDRPPTMQTPESASQTTPRQAAERALADARASGDPGRVAAALVDLGTASLKGCESHHAAEVFAEALALARTLDDPARESEALCGLGQALIADGQPGRALDHLARAVTLARSAGDRFAEKAALDHHGQALAALGDPLGATARFDQALATAAALGDRTHEAELLWLSAVQFAEAGRRDQAAAYATWSVDLLRRLGKPQAEWYAHHLDKFHASTASAKLTTPAPPPDPFLGGSVHAGAVPPPSDSSPGLLRMARTATDAMIKFVGSGFKTTPEALYRARLDVCSACPHHTGLRCRACGCFTAAKAKLLHESCPAGHWRA